jgi:GT2 family glycosyltransferase
MNVKLVTATQTSESMFWSATYLGRSLRRIPQNLRPRLAAAFSNSGHHARGLSEVFNHAIDTAEPDGVLLFVHDDVYLNDWFLAQRLREALERFDIVGLAGSTNPDFSQPSWGLHFDADLNPLGWQPGLRASGAVNHFDYSCPNVSVYGACPSPCVLLDGLFLAIKVQVAQATGLRFDPRFRFHCYDIDFCRTAAGMNLRLGTWPIAVTHDSGGGYNSAAFKEGARLYLDKWRTIAEERISA